MLYGLKLNVERILIPYGEDFIRDTIHCENPHRVIDIRLKDLSLNVRACTEGIQQPCS